MTAPSLSVRVQSHAHKTKGAINDMSGGAYTAELFAFANVAAGTSDVVAAVAGKKIRVLSYSVSGAAGGVATATFISSTGSAAISPLISLGANGFVHEADNNGLFETAAGDKLQLTAATNTVGVRVTYILVV